MVGREVGDIFPTVDHERGEIVFEARERFGGRPGFTRQDNWWMRVSFSVRRGEVLGIAGLMGAGRSDLLMAIFGAHAGRRSGEILIEGRTVPYQKSGRSDQAWHRFCHRGSQTLRTRVGSDDS